VVKAYDAHVISIKDRCAKTLLAKRSRDEFETEQFKSDLLSPTPENNNNNNDNDKSKRKNDPNNKISGRVYSSDFKYDCTFGLENFAEYESSKINSLDFDNMPYPHDRIFTNTINEIMATTKKNYLFLPRLVDRIISRMLELKKF
jgi:hypothetical protein